MGAVTILEGSTGYVFVGVFVPCVMLLFYGFLCLVGGARALATVSSLEGDNKF